MTRERSSVVAVYDRWFPQEIYESPPIIDVITLKGCGETLEQFGVTCETQVKAVSVTTIQRILSTKKRAVASRRMPTKSDEANLINLILSDGTNTTQGEAATRCI